MIEIRAALPGDVPAIVSLVSDTLAEFGLAFGVGAKTDDDLPALPASYEARGGMFWVASDDAQLLGTCGVFPVAPQIYELRKMYLRPAARGLRLGTRLLALATDWVRDAGGTAIVLDTIDRMTAAIAFYEAHGFVRDDAQIRGSRAQRGYSKTI